MRNPLVLKWKWHARVRGLIAGTGCSRKPCARANPRVMRMPRKAPITAVGGLWSRMRQEVSGKVVKIAVAKVV